MRVMLPILLSEMTIKIIMKITYVMGSSFTNLRRHFFHRVSILNALSAPSRVKLYACRVKLFDEASSPHGGCVGTCRLRRPQNGVLGVRPSGCQKDGRLRVLNRDCREDEGCIDLPVRSKLSTLLL